MNKLILATIILSSTAAAFASDEVKQLSDEEKRIMNTPFKKLTMEEKLRRPEIFKHNDNLKFGGYVTLPGTPKGTVRFVNLQKRVAATNLTRVVRSMRAMKTFDVAIVEADCAADIKVYVVDKPSAPALSVFPDDFRAEVNVAKLMADNPKPQFAAARLRKQMLRAFGFLTAGSAYNSDLFDALGSVQDLDKIVHENMPLDVATRAERFLTARGLKPVETVTYRWAIENGCDIAPTNAYQRAIFDEVKRAKKN